MERKLSKKAIISYGFCDLGTVLFVGLINYLTFYSTNMLGISLAITATIQLVCRIWDAVNDIGVGALVDRTHTKEGKARPWIIRFVVPLAVSVLLIFAAPKNGSLGMKIAFVSVGYFLYALFYTTVVLPYGSMMPLMTRDSVEHSKLSTSRSLGAGLGQVVAAAITLPLAAMFGERLGDRAYGYTAVAVLYSVIAIVFTTITYKNCREMEDIQPEPAEKEKKNAVPFMTTLKALVSNKAWVIVFLLSLLHYFRITFPSTCAQYYYLYYLNVDETLSAMFTAMGLLAGLVCVPVVTPLVKRFGYKKTMMCSYAISIVAQLLGYLFGSTPNLCVIFNIVNFIGNVVPVVGVLAMLADAIDSVEVKSGIRSDGLGYSANSFSSKLGPAIAGFVCTITLAIGGLSTSLTSGVGQTPAALSTLRIAFWLVPALMAVIQFILASRYPLSNEKMAEISKELAKKHEDPTYVPHVDGI